MHSTRQRWAPVWRIALATTLILLPGLGSAAAPLRWVETIPLPGVEGRIDHLAVDVQGQRLFVVALGNNTLEVIDLQTGRRQASVRGLQKPQGAAFLPKTNRIVVANGEGGRCVVLDGRSLRRFAPAMCGDDADNVRYDPGADLLYVGAGRGVLEIFRGSDSQRLSEIRLHGHPEAFQLESLGPRIFVNIPSAGHIVVVDRARRAVITAWPLAGARANFPMALDEAHHRLFIGCRDPARLVVYDTDSGRAVADVPIAGDVDDVFYDGARRRVYASGGEGDLSVVTQVDRDHYQPIARVSTASGARTSLFVPEHGRLYLAVPHRGRQPAEIRVYAAEP